ncbi:MFS transporter [Streptomyces sp. NPDC055189]
MILPPRGPLRVYTTLTFFDSLVPGIMLAGGVLFFTEVARLQAVEVGIGLSVAALVGLAAALPMGRLGDRLGQRRLLIGINLLRAVVLGAYQLVDSFSAFLVVASLAGLAESGVAPVRQAYLGTITVPANRVATLAYNRVVHNIGATLSTPALGVALAVDRPIAFRLLVGAGALSVLVVALVAVHLPETRTGAATAPGRRTQASTGVLRDRRYLGPALLNGVLVLHAELLEIGVPLWVANHTQAPAWTTSVLLFVNVLVAIAFQMRVGRSVGDVRSAARALRHGGYSLMAAAAVFALTGSLPPLVCALVLVAAVVLLTLTELWQSAGSWGLSYDLADARRLGEYQGAWNTGTQLARSGGPLLITLALSTAQGTGWLVIGGLYLLASFLAAPLAHRADRRTCPAAQPHGQELAVPPAVRPAHLPSHP